MKLLHTSDWHLGSTLCGKKRYDEFDLFFKWILECIKKEQIDVILISGDIFDTSNPSSKAIEYYFNFLGRVAKTPCQYVVVTAGNHDSPSFLDAPRELLKFLNIFSIGEVSDRYDDEVIVLKDQQNNPFLIVGAVPFLRDKDVRSAAAGESSDEKCRNLMNGIQEHYRNVCAIAEHKRAEAGKEIPVVVMGHLFAAGGRSSEGDGVRELYIGNLARVNTGIFPSGIDYLALGHLHTPQIINNCETIRYSGAPLPMGFSEAQMQKSIVLIEFGPVGQILTREIPIPRFQNLASIKGDYETVISGLRDLKKKGIPAWVEIILDDDRIISEIQETALSIVRGSNIEVLKITNLRVTSQILSQMRMDESLDDLDETEVFIRCLDAHNVSQGQRLEFMELFDEILLGLRQKDQMREENIL
jgi:DNA repair protein SbcD/Mre11